MPRMIITRDFVSQKLQKLGKKYGNKVLTDILLDALEDELYMDASARLDDYIVGALTDLGIPGEEIGALLMGGADDE